MIKKINDWFTVEKIDDSTFAISEYKHFEKAHSYLLLGIDKAILIDTGLGISNVKEVVDSLTSLPIEVLTTHVHWDHIGGHKYFKNFAVHKNEVNWISGNFPLSLDKVVQNLTRQECDFPKDFNINKYKIFHGKPTRILKDGDVIDLGGREIEVIHTPGHSPGHCCFYEMDKKYLYTGDLVYSGTLDMFYSSTNPLDFYNSIKKIKRLDISRILPAHFNINLPVSIINDISLAFEKLLKDEKLKQGEGIFDFGDFKIHL